MTEREMQRLARLVANYVKEMLSKEDDVYLTVKEAASLMHVSPQTIYNNIDRYPHSRQGRRLVFRRSDIVAIIEGREHGQETNRQDT